MKDLPHVMKQALPAKEEYRGKKEKEPHMEMKESLSYFSHNARHTHPHSAKVHSAIFFRFNIHPRKTKGHLRSCVGAQSVEQIKGVTTSLPRQCLFIISILDFSIKVALVGEFNNEVHSETFSSFKT